MTCFLSCKIMYGPICTCCYTYQRCASCILLAIFCFLPSLSFPFPLSFFPLELALVSPTQHYSAPYVSFSYDPFIHHSISPPPFSVELSHSDRGNINQMMHIRETDARKEERSLFTHFHLIVLSLFPRLFCHCMFIHHSAMEPKLHCSTLQSSLPNHLSLYLVLHSSCLTPASPVCIKHTFLISEIPSALYHHIFPHSTIHFSLFSSFFLFSFSQVSLWFITFSWQHITLKKLIYSFIL